MVKTGLLFAEIDIIKDLRNMDKTFPLLRSALTFALRDNCSELGPFTFQLLNCQMLITLESNWKLLRLKSRLFW